MKIKDITNYPFFLFFYWRTERKTGNHNWAALSLILFIFSIIFWCLSPAKISPSGDSSVFIYAGRRILTGDVPYRDFWDHKPPLIFFINAIGLLISNDTLWGIWMIEFFTIGAAVVWGWNIFKRNYGVLAATFAWLLFIISYSLVADGGNNTETIALPFQISIICLLYYAETENRLWQKNMVFFFAGLCLACNFLLRPDLIVLPSMFFVYLTLKYYFVGERQKIMITGISLSIGILIPMCMFGLYFYNTASTNDFFDAVFIYNYVYAASGSTFDRVRAFEYGVSQLSISSIYQISVVGWLTCFYSVAKNRKKSSQIISITKFAILAFPFVILSTILSGRQYNHYYITWLPVLTILCAQSVNFLNNQINRTHSKFVILAIFLVVTAIPLSKNVYNFIKPNRSRNELVEFIQMSTVNTDYLLLWGGGTFYNVVAKRNSPVKFFYQFQWFDHGCLYLNQLMAKEFTNQVKSNKPKLIIDTAYGVPSIKNNVEGLHDWRINTPGSLNVKCPEQKLLYFSDFFDYVLSHYKLTGSISGYDIYEAIP